MGDPGPCVGLGVPGEHSGGGAPEVRTLVRGRGWAQSLGGPQGCPGVEVTVVAEFREAGMRQSLEDPLLRKILG